MARPKYQVFVSSTYRDLIDERREVMWQILRARHIPAGMEWFPSTNDRGWQIIQRMIDQADYYVLLLAGRYGEVDPALEMSWTEREYHHAFDRGLPVLAFVREPGAITADRMERGPEGRERLERFVELIRSRHLTQTWKAADDLGALVSASLHSHILDDEEAGNPRPGWYRGTDVPVPEALETIERLRSENERLRLDLEALRATVESDDQVESRFEQLVRYFASTAANPDEANSFSILEMLRANAREYAVGAIPKSFGSELVLHGMAHQNQYNRIIELTGPGRDFLSEIVLLSDEDIAMIVSTA